MTKLDIWNRALAMLPHDRRVLSETEETTEALRCRDAWQASRDYLLATHDWGWATRAQFHVHGAAEACEGGGRVWVFGRPPGALRVVGVFDGDGRRMRVSVANGVFRAERPAAEVRYIPVMDDSTIPTWPAWFCEAVAADLAIRIAGTILGKAAPRHLESMATKALGEAVRIDAGEVAWSGTDGRTIARARR